MGLLSTTLRTMVEGPYSSTGFMNVSSSLAFMDSVKMFDRRAGRSPTSCARALVTLCFVAVSAVLLSFMGERYKSPLISSGTDDIEDCGSLLTALADTSFHWEGLIRAFDSPSRAF